MEADWQPVALQRRESTYPILSERKSFGAKMAQIVEFVVKNPEATPRDISNLLMADQTSARRRIHAARDRGAITVEKRGGRVFISVTDLGIIAYEEYAAMFSATRDARASHLLTTNVFNMLSFIVKRNPTLSELNDQFDFIVGSKAGYVNRLIGKRLAAYSGDSITATVFGQKVYDARMKAYELIGMTYEI